MTSIVRVKSLRLKDFRNHAEARLAVDADLVGFFGDNGAGKTNLLEALSMLSPGRGLRRAPREALARSCGPDGQPTGARWAVEARLDGPFGEVALLTGLFADEAQRRLRIDGEAAKSLDQLTDHCRILWLAPAMDGLFNGPPGDRRKFLDRQVLAIDPGHGRRVSLYEQAVSGRNRLLGEPRPDLVWLDATEGRIAELGVTIAAARAEWAACLTRLIAADRDPSSAFPSPELTLTGPVEAALALSGDAAELESWLRADLKSGRSRDRAAGRTLLGTHTSDLAVVHGARQMPAERCSTGEQKALLISLTLAQARLVTDLAGQTPILLLDEIAAHLDPSRRLALYSLLQESRCQCFLTGTDRALFEGARMRLFHVHDGEVALAGQ